MTEETIKLYYDLWCDAWKHIRRWMSGLNNSQEYAAKVEREMQEFIETYKQKGCGDFAKDLMADVYAELAQISLSEERMKQ